MTISKLDENTIEEKQEVVSQFKKEDLEYEKGNLQRDIDRLQERINQIDNLLSYFK